MGRPSLYRAEYAEQALKLCRLGATDMELADFFDVDRSTIWRWSQEHEAFCSALKAGKEAADERVIRSLYAKATGYSFESVKILQNNGVGVEVPYREHIPPDTTAAIFWLKNRRPGEWRDRQQQEHSGSVEVKTNDAFGAVANLLAEAERSRKGGGGGQGGVG